MKLNWTWNIKRTVGLLIAVLTPVIAIPATIALIAWAQNFYFIQLWSQFIDSKDITSKFISLSIIPNLGWFYLFLNKERYDIARGIIIGSALYLPVVLYLKFW